MAGGSEILSSKVVLCSLGETVCLVHAIVRFALYFRLL